MCVMCCNKRNSFFSKFPTLTEFYGFEIITAEYQEVIFQQNIFCPLQKSFHVSGDTLYKLLKLRLSYLGRLVEFRHKIYFKHLVILFCRCAIRSEGRILQESVQPIRITKIFIYHHINKTTTTSTS